MTRNRPRGRARCCAGRLIGHTASYRTPRLASLFLVMRSPDILIFMQMTSDVATDADHYHSAANAAKGEKRGLPNKGYRPGRKTARRQDKERERNGGQSVLRP
jgi:hypothetical protein